MISVFQNGRELSLKRFNFSGGEVQIRIEDELDMNLVTVKAVIRSSDDVMATLLVRDAIRCINESISVKLICPYFPYARQDRAVYKGEAFGARVMAGLLKNQFNEIEFWDIHSHVSLDMFKNAYSLDAYNFVAPHIRKKEFIVAPDHGAKERAIKCSDITGNSFLQMAKSRDPDTGYLSKFSLESLVDDFEKDYGAIIIDDICDGGRTFVGAANVLREHVNGPLRLYVTHGIFSAGFDSLLEVFDEILVANIMTDEKLPERVKVIGR